MFGRPKRAQPPAVTLTIDGQRFPCPPARRFSAPRPRSASTIPTLCYLETLRPVNVCRLCVVEVEGARVLVPACARAVEPDMVVQTRSPRVVHSRRLVLELLASSVDLSTARAWPRCSRSTVCARAIRPATASRQRTAIVPLPVITKPPDVEYAATVAQPVKIDNELYVRDYGEVRALLQVRRSVRRRLSEHLCDCGRRPRIRRTDIHRVRGAAAGFGMRLLRQLHRRVSDWRADGEPRVRAARSATNGTKRVRASATPSVRIAAWAARCALHVQDGAIVKATSPLDNDITQGQSLHQRPVRVAVRATADRE